MVLFSSFSLPTHSYKPCQTSINLIFLHFFLLLLSFLCLCLSFISFNLFLCQPIPLLQALPTSINLIFFWHFLFVVFFNFFLFFLFNFSSFHKSLSGCVYLLFTLRTLPVYDFFCIFLSFHFSSL